MPQSKGHKETGRESRSTSGARGRPTGSRAKEEEEKKADLEVGAPKVETPESPAPAPVEREDDEPQMETPESPAVPAEATAEADDDKPTPPDPGPDPGPDVPVPTPLDGNGASDLPTYISLNNAGDPAMRVDIDTTVASPLANRPSVFSPPDAGTTTPAPDYVADSGTSSQMADRPGTFDQAVTTLVIIDPGLVGTS